MWRWDMEWREGWVVASCLEQQLRIDASLQRNQSRVWYRMRACNAKSSSPFGRPSYLGLLFSMYQLLNGYCEEWTSRKLFIKALERNERWKPTLLQNMKLNMPGEETQAQNRSRERQSSIGDSYCQSTGPWCMTMQMNNTRATQRQAPSDESANCDGSEGKCVGERRLRASPSR